MPSKAVVLLLFICVFDIIMIIISGELMMNASDSSLPPDFIFNDLNFLPNMANVPVSYRQTLLSLFSSFVS